VMIPKDASMSRSTVMIMILVPMILVSPIVVVIILRILATIIANVLQIVAITKMVVPMYQSPVMIKTNVRMIAVLLLPVVYIPG